MDKPKQKSELTVIVKAKELCKYVMTVTQKSPKQFRFTFTGRLQNLTLDVLECLFRANDTFVEKGDHEAMRVRSGFMHTAMTHLKILAYFAMLAMEQKCILPKQYEQIVLLSGECMNLLGGWMNSDKRRFKE